jgi:2-methylcitrate dehydratase PrpD
MEPYFQAGMGARNGLFAVRLAKAGAITSSQALEGDYGFFRTYGGEPADIDILLGPRESLGVAGVGTKRFAACLQNQQTLAKIVDGLESPLDGNDIELVTVHRPPVGTNGMDSPGIQRESPFPNMLAAQMSARFTTAAALLGRPVSDPVFYQEFHADPAVVGLADRVNLDPTDDQSIWVDVVFTDGTRRVFDADASDVLFPPPNSFRTAFVERAATVIAERAERAADLIDDLENVPDMRELSWLFRGESGAR